MKLVQLKATLTDNVGYTRKKYQGAWHLVFPVTLLKAGVHSGSSGPTYYPAEELAKYPSAWNGIPLPVFHPTAKDGTPVIANDPEILEKTSVGRLFGVFYDEKKEALKGEAWVNEAKAQEINPAVLDTLLAGKMLEVSTGLFADGDETPGTINEEEYNETASNYRPEHLALLPGGVGACSIEDGCGIRANCSYEGEGLCPCELSKRAEEIKNEKQPIKIQQYNKNEKPQLVKLVKSLAHSAGLSTMELSHGDIRDAIHTKLREMHKNDYAWLREVFTSLIVYEVEGKNNNKIKLYKRSYSITDSGDVVLGDDLIEVKEKRTYVPVINQKGGEDKMKVDEKLVVALIENKDTKWETTDKEFLMGLEDCQFAKLEAEQKEEVIIPEGAKAELDGVDSTYTNGEWVKDEVDEGNEDDKPMTMEAYLEEAPAELKEVLTNGIAMLDAEKARLIEGIKANEANIFTDEDLKGKGVDELKALAALAHVKAPVHNYAGGNGALGDGGHVEEAMVAPTLEDSK